MALTQEEQNMLRLAKENLKDLPYYISEFYEDKEDNFSVNTLSKYIYEYKNFFNWLVVEGIVNVNKAKEVPLDALDGLRKDVVKTYFDKLNNENIASEIKQKHKVYETRKDTTVNRAKSALRSLFKYLVNETENDAGDTYIERNVMEKFPLKRIKVSAATRASALNDKILKQNQIKGFLEFLRNDYENTIADNHRKLSTFRRDKERDFAICSLFLGSGIRLAELVSLEINNIDFHNVKISVDRKGGAHQTLSITIDSLLAIERYLEVRNKRYIGAEYSPFLFVTSHGGIKNISHRAIQNIVQKYTTAYLEQVTNSKSVNGLSPHKLRHSFSLVYYEETEGDIKLLSEQLGHSNLNTTSLYVNMADETRAKAMERVSEALNNEHFSNE
ncbi:tyrosine recombinase XerS [Lysinibacillus xylanilyticus]|uniref:Tyrosine recombinase XerS n=1 Tax=Lysinibacillus xylanilyticus TaxID=582475 RepID=A0A2M9Q5P3_9BACI|nr:tyrosine recombinase XerS [Lysinibacillus xylanilyticus]PJO43397.1 tyrosine recombinase XerS [Lysinibacillus xylanilyticus]